MVSYIKFYKVSTIIAAVLFIASVAINLIFDFNSASINELILLAWVGLICNNHFRTTDRKVASIGDLSAAIAITLCIITAWIFPESIAIENTYTSFVCMLAGLYLVTIKNNPLLLITKVAVLAFWIISLEAIWQLVGIFENRVYEPLAFVAIFSILVCSGSLKLYRWKSGAHFIFNFTTIGSLFVLFVGAAAAVFLGPNNMNDVLRYTLLISFITVAVSYLIQLACYTYQTLKRRFASG